MQSHTNVGSRHSQRIKREKQVKRISKLKRANKLVKQRELSILRNTLFAFCKSIDTPVALRVWLCFKYGCYAELQAPIDPLSYCNVADFQKDYVLTEFLSKYIFEDNAEIHLQEAALQRFNTAEHLCSETNILFEAYTSGAAMPLSREVHEVLHLAARKIGELLGQHDPYQGFDECKWGPGSTASISAELASRVTKVCEGRISVTKDGIAPLRALLSLDPFWLEARGLTCDGPTSFLDIHDHYVVNDFSKLTFVPKNAKTHRIIGAEPTANVFMQLGIAQVLRRALRSVGVNLNDQSINQRAARQSSITGKTVTVDESMASDLVSRELVGFLLPPDWHYVLALVRTPYYYLRSEGATLLKGEFHKWSSMGNGYTFELESLIFWALAQSSIEISGVSGRARIYGDDIILPTKSYRLLSDVFRFTGFLVNEEKTHTEGYFRESCGEHYFNGFCVTPVFQRDRVTSLSELIRLHNRLYRLNAEMNGAPKLIHYDQPWRRHFKMHPIRVYGIELDTVLSTIRREVENVFEQCGIHFYQPNYWEGDGGIIVDGLTFRRHVVTVCGPGVIPLVPALVATPHLREADTMALYALSLRFGSAPPEMPQGFEGVRVKVVSYRRGYKAVY